MNFDRVTQLPVVRTLYRWRFDKAFATDWVGIFRGVYQSFGEAAAAAPNTKPLGYDHETAADMYSEHFERIMAADYPVLFWLERAFRSGCRSVFDLGGHVGVSFYGFRKYLTFPERTTWRVLDVPAVVRKGRTIAQQQGVDGSLLFTGEYSDMASADILLALGSLQYIDTPTLAERLAELVIPPQHLIINKLPLTAGDGYVTLQNIGTAFCPYRVFNDRSFISSIEALGYQLRDRWENPELSCTLPLTPSYTVKRYSGLYFDRIPSGQ